MPAFIPLTDSLTGEPVIVNASAIRCLSEEGSTTVIDFEGAKFVQVSESILTVYSKLIKIGCICAPADLRRD